MQCSEIRCERSGRFAVKPELVFLQILDDVLHLCRLLCRNWAALHCRTYVALLQHLCCTYVALMLHLCHLLCCSWTSQMWHWSSIQPAFCTKTHPSPAILKYCLQNLHKDEKMSLRRFAEFLSKSSQQWQVGESSHWTNQIWHKYFQNTNHFRFISILKNIFKIPNILDFYEFCVWSTVSIFSLGVAPFQMSPAFVDLFSCIWELSPKNEYSERVGSAEGKPKTKSNSLKEQQQCRKQQNNDKLTTWIAP